ncbi:hypothetical protein NB311A_21266 [Nitrobacter sp. Nb-311A]|nr:hypothetical protein NB311A_21266 [Nitrobacter sp. Nb-311A]
MLAFDMDQQDTLIKGAFKLGIGLARAAEHNRHRIVDPAHGLDFPQ